MLAQASRRGGNHNAGRLERPAAGGKQEVELPSLPRAKAATDEPSSPVHLETGLHLGRRSAAFDGFAATGPRRRVGVRGQARAIASKSTLRQAWHRWKLMPQYAFKISMFNVCCNSH